MQPLWLLSNKSNIGLLSESLTSVSLSLEILLVAPKDKAFVFCLLNFGCSGPHVAICVLLRSADAGCVLLGHSHCFDSVCLSVCGGPVSAFGSHRLGHTMTQATLQHRPATQRKPLDRKCIRQLMGLIWVIETQINADMMSFS